MNNTHISLLDFIIFLVALVATFIAWYLPNATVALKASVTVISVLSGMCASYVKYLCGVVTDLKAKLAVQESACLEITQNRDALKKSLKNRDCELRLRQAAMERIKHYLQIYIAIPSKQDIKQINDLFMIITKEEEHINKELTRNE